MCSLKLPKSPTAKVFCYSIYYCSVVCVLFYNSMRIELSVKLLNDKTRKLSCIVGLSCTVFFFSAEDGGDIVNIQLLLDSKTKFHLTAFILSLFVIFSISQIPSFSLQMLIPCSRFHCNLRGTYLSSLLLHFVISFAPAFAFGPSVCGGGDNPHSMVQSYYCNPDHSIYITLATFSINNMTTAAL